MHYPKRDSSRYAHLSDDDYTYIVGRLYVVQLIMYLAGRDATVIRNPVARRVSRG